MLHCEDGSHHFVKAASLIAQRMFAEAYREEARKLAALPEDAPAPRLLWTLEAYDWFALSTEYVAARAPARPWQPAELQACVDMLVAAAAGPHPTPDRARPAARRRGVRGVAGVLGPPAGHPTRTLPHLEEAAALAATFAEVTAGSTLVHTDVRDDNLLLAADGRVLLCDWNWPMVGAAWLDSLFLLIGPRGDGLDVEAVISRHPLLSAVPPEHIDVVLALVVGYFLKSADDPVPTTSPFLRDAQRWQGEVCWDWLCERRGWAPDRGHDLRRYAARCYRCPSRWRSFAARRHQT